jgi:hypothetical protein
LRGYGDDAVLIRPLVARGGDQRHPVAVREVHRACRGLDDHALLLLLVRRVGRVARAVEQPRVDVERHVDHVDADLAGVGQRVDGRLDEEVARVLAGADVDDVDLRGDAGHPDAVERRADRAGHVRAVAVVVLIDGVDAARVLARAVVDTRLGVVDREVAAQEAVEVRRDVGVLAVDARVHDPDADGVAALIVRVGARRRGADELHVPLQARERVAVDRARAWAVAVEVAALGLDVAPRWLRRRPGRVSVAWLRAAPSSAALASAFLAKLGSLDCTVATPTSVFSETIVPPASRTAWWAAAVLAPAW